MKNKLGQVKIGILLTIVTMLFVIGLIVFVFSLTIGGVKDSQDVTVGGDNSEQFLTGDTQSLSNAHITSLTATTDNETWLEFNGETDYVDIDNFRNDMPTTNISFSVWIYPTDNVSSGQVIFNFATGSDNRLGMMYYSDSIRGGYYDGSSYVSKASTNETIPLNEWHHVVYNRNVDGSGELYFNGRLQSGTNSPFLSSHSQYTIGSKNDHSDLFFNGSISGFKMYRKLLSSDEVLELSQSRGSKKTDSYSIGLRVLPDSPKRLSQHSMECHEDVVYFATGLDADDSYNHINDFFSYNTSTMEFENLSDVPIRSQSATLREVNGKIYFIGGYRSDLALLYNTTYEYDISTDTWTQKASFFNPREDFASAVVGDDIYIFGGRSSPQSPHTSTNNSMKYDTLTDTWSNISEMPSPKWSGDFAVSRGEIIYLISSAIDLTDYPDMPTMTNRSWAYNTTDDTYTEIAEILTPVAYKEVDFIGDALYVFGGNIQPNTVNKTNIIQVYNITSDTWSYFNSNLSNADSGRASAKCENGKIYINVKERFYEFGNISDKIYDFGFNENNGDVVYEKSGSGKTGDIIGATWETDGSIKTLVNGTDYEIDQATGLFTIENDDYAWTTIDVNYSYFYTANEIGDLADDVLSIGSVTDWFPIFIVIGAMVVLILLTVIIIMAVRGSGLMGGSA